MYGWKQNKFALHFHLFVEIHNWKKKFSWIVIYIPIWYWVGSYFFCKNLEKMKSYWKKPKYPWVCFFGFTYVLNTDFIWPYQMLRLTAFIWPYQMLRLTAIIWLNQRKLTEF
jgi:hypothetical protein